ncbi:unnamed protein product [Soboliphyme baturini]|uniref:Sulfate_transp domain-containing protein n=1 Tax=Soboliphyme baturini TaxID=241478 RepID=A0A183IU08_9BILA|nr:unnamed protein product [Soboliphyme baturini]
MAGATPSNGLYTAFYPGFLYFLLGVSAIVSLMISSATYRLAPGEAITYESGSYSTSSLTILMGVLQFDAITVLISNQVSAGFTAAAGVQALSNQLPPILGIRVRRKTGFAGLFYVSSPDLLSQIALTNHVTLYMALICMAILIVTKEYINPLIGRHCRLKIPVPAEIMVIVLGMLADSLFSLNQHYGVAVVGPIPVGLPEPTVPKISLFSSLFFDAVIISIVIYSVSLSLARTFSEKHSYEIDPSQELYAFGFIQLFVSFFTCQPPAAALARSMVLENSGGRSQFASVISSMIILSVIFFVGRFLGTLPKCVLAAIICVAMKGVILQLRQLPALWRLSKCDFTISVTAFVAVIVLDVSNGLFVAICFAFLLVSVRGFW